MTTIWRARPSLVEGEGAVPFLRHSGADSRCIRAAISRASCAPPQGQMAGGARDRALDPFLHRLRSRAAAQVLRRFLHGKDNGWDKHAHSCRCATSTSSSNAPRTNGRSSAPSGPSSTRCRRRAWREAPRRQGGEELATLGDGVTFDRAVDQGNRDHRPSALKLFVSSSTSDADLFVVLRVFSPDLGEVVFQAQIVHTPIGQGWLRASHRKLDKKLSTPCPTTPTTRRSRSRKARVAGLDIEIWPTSIVVPAGHRVALTIRGKDYVSGSSGGKLSNFKNEPRGCGPFLHDDPRDRPPAIFGGITQYPFGGGRPISCCRSFRPKPAAGKLAAAAAASREAAAPCRRHRGSSIQEVDQSVTALAVPTGDCRWDRSHDMLTTLS